MVKPSHPPKQLPRCALSVSQSIIFCCQLESPCRCYCRCRCPCFCHHRYPYVRSVCTVITPADGAIPISACLVSHVSATLDRANQRGVEFCPVPFAAKGYILHTWSGFVAPSRTLNLSRPPFSSQSITTRRRSVGHSGHVWKFLSWLWDMPASLAQIHVTLGPPKDQHQHQQRHNARSQATDAAQVCRSVQVLHDLARHDY